MFVVAVQIPFVPDSASRYSSIYSLVLSTSTLAVALVSDDAPTHPLECCSLGGQDVPPGTVSKSYVGALTLLAINNMFSQAQVRIFENVS